MLWRALLEGSGPCLLPMFPRFSSGELPFSHSRSLWLGCVLVLLGPVCCTEVALSVWRLWNPSGRPASSATGGAHEAAGGDGARSPEGALAGW